MHAFMAAVLLRVTGLDSLALDTEPEPPDRELGEVEEGIRAGEGNTVVGADGLGQAELLEYGFKYRESIGFLGGGERLAGEEIAAGEVGDRERVAITPVSEHELALVVGAPQVIGLAGKGKCRSLRSVASSHSAFDQAVAVEDRMHRADRGRVDVRIEAGQLFPDLRRPPARLVLLETQDPRLDLKG